MRHDLVRQGRSLLILTCLAVLLAGTAGTHAQVVPMKLVRVATGLSSPLFVTAPRGDTSRLFVVQQGGLIRILNLQTMALNATPFLSVTGIITGGERGLLGLAFDPDYAKNGKFYVYVTVSGGVWGAGSSQVRQYQVSANPDVANTAFTTVIAFDQPQSNHNGGWIGFSPRPGDTRNLYIASGDGGGSNDQGTGHIEPGGNSQNNTTLLGKMLRISIDAATGTYTIPADNPFASAAPPIRREIFTNGLRNPYRSAFDRLTGDLFIGDVGQSAREEISVQKASNPGGGENFEWRLREGFIQTPGGNPAVGGASPPGGVPPIYDYPRSVGGTVIGGYIYRGPQIPSLRGVYVFGDYLGSNRVYTLNYNGATASGFQNIGPTLASASGFSISNLSSLGEDANGELYLVDITNQSVSRLEPVTPHVVTTGVSKVPGGSASISGRGLPFRVHTVQAANTLVEPFSTIGTTTAAGTGELFFEEEFLPPGPAQRFYRFVSP